MNRMRPRLEIDGAGIKYLTVYYHGDSPDYTRIIREGFQFHKIDETESRMIPVLVLPMKDRKD